VNHSIRAHAPHYSIRLSARQTLIGAVSISFMLRYLQRAGLGVYVAYRLLLAGLVVATVLLGLR
jgi:hypothetical protein